MTEQYPDNWVVLKLKSSKYDKGIYKVLAGWLGGYIYGDSWRMNSGITNVEQQGYLYGFYGSSGSVYWCHKGNYRLSAVTACIFNSFKKEEVFEGQITLMPEDTNWFELNYG